MLGFRAVEPRINTLKHLIVFSKPFFAIYRAANALTLRTHPHLNSTNPCLFQLNVAPPPKPHYPDIIVSSQNPHKVSASGMPPPSYDSRQANPPISNLQGIGSPNGSDVSEELMPMDTPPLGNYVPPVSLPQINNVSHLPENLPRT